MIPERQPEGPYLSFVSNASGRHTTLEDDGYSAWLYLTSQSKYEVIATAFVYSRVELPEFRVMPHGKSGPPLLLRQFATAAAVQRSVPEDLLRVTFSSDGNSAVVLLRGEPWAFVTYDQKHGYSKSLSVAGPFGYPWDEQLYHEHFQNIHVG
jgi:hypothetical protein